MFPALFEEKMGTAAVMSLLERQKGDFLHSQGIGTKSSK